MTEPSDIHLNPREVAELGLPRMTGAVNAQLQQLQTLQASAGGPSSMSVDKQIAGLQLVKLNLPALLTYARQLEGQAAGLAALKTPPDYSDELLTIADRITAAAPDGRALAAVVALQTAGAPPVPVTVPTAPAYTGISISIGTQQQAWRDGYTAGYRQAWADVLASIKARL